MQLKTNDDLRKDLLNKRWSISLDEKRSFDHLIYKNVMKEIEKGEHMSRYVACYWPIENEVDTLGIISHLLEKGIFVCLPAIHDNKMYFKQITSLSFPYETWKSLRQPLGDEYITQDQIQIMLIPMIGFDSNNFRLGYGKNFYNNFLKTASATITIGLAYKFQKCNDIVLGEKDIKLDKIITD